MDATETLRTVYRLVRRIPVLRGVVRRMLPTMVATVDGDRYELHPRDNETDRKMWLRASVPEPRSHRALEELIRGRETLFLDIGANSGSYSIRAARIAASGSTLIAVEPNAAMVARLRRNLDLNGLADRVRVLECALAAETGEATMLLAAGNFGQASLRVVSKERGRITVPTRRLADVLPADARDAFFVVKIDVEGFEDDVLRPFVDASPDDSLPRAILMETSHADAWRSDLSGLLAARGYVATFKAEGNTLLQRTD